MPQRETTKHHTPRPPFGAPHVFVLAVIDGADPQGVHRIDRAETILGREDADLLIDDDEISKRHCLIRADGPVCTLTDLGSLIYRTADDEGEHAAKRCDQHPGARFRLR